MHTIRVDFHCHSVHSDGVMTPRELAESLAADGVVVAALTDHNSVEGLEEFRQALARREIGFVPAVEITTQHDGREVHLLAYGIDSTHLELHATLVALRHAYAPSVHSVAESIRTKGVAVFDKGVAISDGRLDIIDAIDLVHRAGGRAFLAHPLVLETNPAFLEALLVTLKAHGLDGIEAFYAPYTEAERDLLFGMAQRIGLLVSAGTDTHDRRTSGSTGIDMPIVDWKAFRDAIGRWTAHDRSPGATFRTRKSARFKWRNFIFHIIFPTLLATVLFITAIYAVFLPAFERTLIERKREMIRELTNSAWSILAGFESDERDGHLTRDQAQEMAISRIASLRYGRDGKDYFWLQDMHPRIIMHPYRKDLNGQDVSAFRDPRGVAIFVAFADLIKREQEGYAVYVWQWNDDPSRLEPKESYVRGFAPWGWIIGTGLYIEDVAQEIKRIERSLVNTSLVISVIVVSLLLYVVLKSLRMERERAEVEEDLHESTERYRSLVEATTEGVLLVMDSRCRYANQIFLEMLGCSHGELEFLDLLDLFPEIKDNAVAWKHLHSLLQGDEVFSGFDAILRRRDGALIDCVLSLSQISVAGRDGFILHSRMVAPLPEVVSSHDAAKRDTELQHVIEESPVGVFRARASARGTLTAYNHAAAQLFSSVEFSESQPLALADLFPDTALYDKFLEDLQRHGTAICNLHHSLKDMSNRMLAINAKLIRDDQGTPRSINGILEDVTNQHNRENEREETIERLQTPLLFLHESISRLTQRAVRCNLDTPIDSVAMMMNERQTSTALVQTESGHVVGIVTDGDICRRVVAAGLDQRTPVLRVMSAPIVSINEQAVVYEALLLMEQRHINHLVVEDESGRVSGTICHQELLQFQHYGSMVLTREIELALTPFDVVRCCRRVPGLARALLECGAHAHVISRLISSVCDATTLRLISFVEADLGPAPVPYLFMSLGSHGRQEMTLASDQDNAIIFEAPEDPGEIAAAEQYLNALGRYVCEWLDRSGYPFCRGGIIAQNSQWCQPVPNWKAYFREWINRAEPKQLLEFTVFFDFHPVYGATRLAEDLRRYVFEQLNDRPAFYPHFAQNSLQFKPPKRLFGRILGGGSGKEQAGVFDLKEAVIPIVSFARLYSLRHEIDATNTLERLHRLAEVDVLTEASFQAISEAYEFLMRLNLQHQAETLAAGQSADNSIHLRRLGPTEQTLLYQAFTQIDAIQKRVSYDFLSGTA